MTAENMPETQIENLVGALALALADDLLRAAQQHVPLAAPAAALALVSHAPGLTIDQLSRALGLSHPGAVRLVDRLVSDDLVRRARSPQDGRAVSLYLTPSGETISQQILASRQGVLSHALASLSPEDRATLGRLAATMLGGLLRDEDHAFAVCRLCDPSICPACPVEAEINGRTADFP